MSTSLHRAPVTVLLLAAIVLGLLPSVPALAAPRNAKYEICHRTNALNNPYRRINVSWSALGTSGSGHGGHTGLPFDSTYAPHATKSARWGDVFHAVKAGTNGGGANTRQMNWTAAGQAIFAGSTYQLPGTGATRQACRAIPTIEYIESEVAAGVPLAEVMAEVDSQGASEDLALLTAIGGSFAAWYAQDPTRTLAQVVEGLVAQSPSATTGAATDLTPTSARVAGTVDTKGASADLLFEYWTGTGPRLEQTATPATTTSVASPTATLSGLNPATTYSYRTIARVSAGSGDGASDQDVTGETRTFTTPALNAPTVTTTSLPDGQVGVAYDLALSASGGTPPHQAWSASGLPPGLSLAPATGRLSGTPTEVGVSTIAVSVAGADGTRSPERVLTLTVAPAPAKQPRTLVLDVDRPIAAPGDDVTLSATADPTVEDAAITYELLDGPCTLTGRTLRSAAAVTCTVQARTAADATHLAAVSGPADVVFAVPDPGTPDNTITFDALEDRFVDADPFAVAAVASSELPVAFTSQTPDVCRVEAATVTPITAGVCTITASQPGGPSDGVTYPAATPVSRSFTVGRRASSIVFAEVADRPLDAGHVTITVASSSGLPVEVISLTPAVCTIVDRTITLVAVGTCQLRASHGGDATYLAADDVGRAFEVTPGAPAEPPVTQPPVSQPPVSQPPVTQPPVTQPPVTQPPVTPGPRPLPPRATDPGPSPRPTPTQPGLPRAVTPAPTPPPPPSGPRPTATPPPSTGGQPVARTAAPTPSAVTVTPRLGTAAERMPVTDGTGRSPTAVEDRPVARGGSAAGTESAAVDSVDLGTGAHPGDTADLSSAARRSLTGLGREILGGFRLGSSAFVEVIGSRTAGQFVLSSLDQVDAYAVAAAVRESMERTATSFAAIGGVEVASEADAVRLSQREADVAERERVLAAADLPGAVDVTQVETSADSHWLGVSASVETYLPGSTVYLAVTSDPLVFAEARVDRHGRADLAGAFPIEAVGVGGHRLRIVGTRALGGVTVDGEGSVQLSRDTLLAIREFDGDTHATVTVVGTNTEGGNHRAVRIVPLSETAPWWTLLVVAAAAAGTWRWRRRDRLGTRRRLVTATLVCAAAAIPALVLGWLAIAYPVMGWGAVAAFGAGVGVWVVRPRRADDDVASTADGDDHLDPGQAQLVAT